MSPKVRKCQVLPDLALCAPNVCYPNPHTRKAAASLLNQPIKLSLIGAGWTGPDPAPAPPTPIKIPTLTGSHLEGRYATAAFPVQRP